MVETNNSEVESLILNRYFMYLSYDGTNYHGWQIQPNGISVQECINKALSTILRKDTEVTGAGRTDAGVHASMMVAHFDSVMEREDAVRLVDKMNRLLPRDIAIQRIVPVRNDAHARFDAVSRTYKYYITDVKSPFDGRYRCRMYCPLDYDRMNSAAQTLFDYTDFTSFSRLHTDVKTNNCKIMHASWERLDEHDWVFTIKADRFLRNMVRAIVGTLIDVGRGKLTVQGFRDIIEQQDRGKAGTSAPGNALFLCDIAYPDDLFI